MDDETPPRTRKQHVPWWATVLVFAVLAGAAGAAWFFGSQPKNGVRFEQLQAEAAEKLPPGSTREDVKAWFAQRGITSFGDLTNAGGQVDGYWATVPNDTWFETAEISMMIRFDKEGKLTTLSMSRPVSPRNN